MNQKRIEAYVTGKVQGVWYRAFTQSSAMALGVSGFVENLDDGRVHLVAMGPEERVDALVAELKNGPPGADVTDVAVSEYTGEETFSGFATRY